LESNASPRSDIRTHLTEKGSGGSGRYFPKAKKECTEEQNGVRVDLGELDMAVGDGEKQGANNLALKGIKLQRKLKKQGW